MVSGDFFFPDYFRNGAMNGLMARSLVLRGRFALTVSMPRTPLGSASYCLPGLVDLELTWQLQTLLLFMIGET